MITIKTKNGIQRIKGDEDSMFVVIGLDNDLNDIIYLWTKGNKIQETYDYIAKANNVACIKIAQIVSPYFDAK